MKNTVNAASRYYNLHFAPDVENALKYAEMRQKIKTVL